MAIAEELKVVVRAEVDKAKRELQQFNSTLNEGERKAGGFNTKMLAVGAAVAAGVIAFRQLVRVGQELIGAFTIQEQAEARLGAVIEATGQAAGFTAEQLTAQAAALQKVTTFGDESIIELQSILATFKSIQGEGFERTTELALDLSAAFGQDLKSSAIQLGKALEDPSIGLTALRRIGVTFSEEQQNMIKAMQEAGDVAGAQAEILNTLEAQVGGVAQAAADTASGELQQLKNVFGDMKEAVGGLLLEGLRPMIEPLSNIVTKFTEWVVKLREAKEEANNLARVLKEDFGDIIGGESNLQILQRQLQAVEAAVETQREIFARAQEAYENSLEAIEKSRGQRGFEQIVAVSDAAYKNLLEQRDALNQLINDYYRLEGAVERAADAEQRLADEAPAPGGLGGGGETGPPTSFGADLTGPWGALQGEIVRTGEEVVAFGGDIEEHFLGGVVRLRGEVEQITEAFSPSEDAMRAYREALINTGSEQEDQASNVHALASITELVTQRERDLAAAREHANEMTIDAINAILGLADDLFDQADLEQASEEGKANMEVLNADIELFSNLIERIVSGNFIGAIVGFIQDFINVFRAMGRATRRNREEMEDLAKALEEGADVADELTTKWQQVEQQEFDAMQNRLDLLRDQLDEERDIRDEALRKLERYFNQEYDVLRDQWERNLISTEEFQNRMEEMNEEYDEQRTEIESIVDAIEDLINALTGTRKGGADSGLTIPGENAVRGQGGDITVNVMGDSYGVDVLGERVMDAVNTAQKRGYRVA